jgi:hypothetical protein
VQSSWNLGTQLKHRLLLSSPVHCFSFGTLLAYTEAARICNTENICYVFAIHPVRWRVDCCLATSSNISPLRASFHCCALERVYGAVAWKSVDQIRYNNIKNVLSLLHLSPVTRKSSDVDPERSQICPCA